MNGALHKTAEWSHLPETIEAWEGAMIAAILATAAFAAGMQAGIDRPRTAFNTCLSESAIKATAEKVAVDAYRAYLETACSNQISAFKAASISFDVKNKIARKQATDDAEIMINDWLQSAVDSYTAKTARARKSERGHLRPPVAPAGDRGLGVLSA